MMERVFLWCWDRKIFEPSHQVLSRRARKERQRFLDSFVGSVVARLSPETIAMMTMLIAHVVQHDERQCRPGIAG